jgi:hypothetical protein
VKHFSVIGSGSIVNFFAHSLYRKSVFDRPEISLAQGKVVAAYLAYLAKTQLSSVGGRSKLATLDSSGRISYAQLWEAPLWERFFAEYQEMQGKLMLACANPVMGNNRFLEELEGFSIKLKERKKEMLRDAKGWGKLFSPYPDGEKQE